MRLLPTPVVASSRILPKQSILILPTQRKGKAPHLHNVIIRGESWNTSGQGDYDGKDFFKSSVLFQQRLPEFVAVLSGDQTNNSTIEKYYYNNSPANCDTFGGLYQWNEAMRYLA
jgi:hypothetical protein